MNGGARTWPLRAEQPVGLGRERQAPHFWMEHNVREANRGGSGGGTPPPPPPAAEVSYAGFRIRRTGDGWVASKRGLNVIPGASTFASAEDAMQGVDVLMAVSDGIPLDQRFHHLFRAIARACGKLK